MAQSKILHIEKDATVPGGTADAAGETINYTLAVTNQGNAAIAGVVVNDPFTTNEAPVLVGAFNVGDTDQDNLLDVSETWQYTASHQVTQAELDAGTPIVNTATVTGTGATPDNDDASVAVAQSKILHIEKDADGSGRHGELDQRRHQLHAGGDQPGQCGDCRCGGGRSVHDQRGAGSGRRLQYRRHRPGQSAGCQRDLAVHGQPSGDAGRAGRRAPIVNTATVTGTGATPDTDDASVPVAQSKILHIEKDATVPGGTATRPATSSTTRWR